MFSEYFSGEHENDLMPGKFVLEQRAVYVPYGGKEVKLESCEILLNDNYGWTASSIGDIHGKAVIGGSTSSGEDLFIGRVSHDGLMMPGKIHPSHKTMYVPSGAGEHGYKSYEILVTSSEGDSLVIQFQFCTFLILGFKTEVFSHSTSQSTFPGLPKPNAPESSYVPVPAANFSQAAKVAQTSSGNSSLQP